MTTIHSVDRTQRLLPLAGVLAGGLTMAGNLIIGPFPEASTPAERLPGYYATHAGHVAIGAALLGWGALFLAVFGIALAARFRSAAAPPALVWTAVVGTAVGTTFFLMTAAQCQLLAEAGIHPHLDPAALQAWQISASMFGSSGGIVLLLAAVAVAGIRYRAVPAWLGWTGLLLGVAQLYPTERIAFLASLVFLLWAAVAGIALAVRPPTPVPAARSAVPVG
jgi:hypothetical protein